MQPLGLVDAHHHFWDPARADYPWMTDEVAPIRRRFGPEDLAPHLAACGVDATVVVQARMDVDETRELLAIAEATDFVRGVVGWADLTADDPLDGLAHPKLVGIRHQAHDEPDPAWLARPEVLRGIRAVGEAGLAYDLLVRTRELPAALEAARALSEVRFVVDHLAKPPIRTGDTAAWAEALAPLSDLPNVHCKLSGLVTEANPDDAVAPFVRRGLDLFGPERCLFGSDWPVCLLAATYEQVFATIRDATTAAERDEVLGGTAARVYALA
jgi:L-fuconolactonase